MPRQVDDKHKHGGGGGLVQVQAIHHAYADDDEDGYDDDDQEMVVEAVACEAEEEVHSDQDDESEEPRETQANHQEEEVVDAYVAEEHDDDNDDDDEEEVMAAVVVEDATGEEDVAPVDEEEEEEAVVVVKETPIPRKKKKAPPKSSTHGGGSPPGSNKSKDKMKKKSKKTKTKKKSKTSRDKDLHEVIAVRPECLEAANDAREMLKETVPELPIALAETSVRSFGRLYVDPRAHSANQKHRHTNKFATTSALYPIGFSCDRYEFSPAHGRTVKMRCSILDGRKIKEKQRLGGFDVAADIHDGPVFRLMWGQGVDEQNDEDSVYNPSVHSAPILDNHSKSSEKAYDVAPKALQPDAGMRVRVRFDKNQYYCGCITSVVNPEISPKKSKKRKQQQPVQLSIRYDDGSTEELAFPDPDVTILLPGAEEEVDSLGNVELVELNGKKVTSVIGMSPLQAWGKALIKLGLLDEIMFESAFETIKRYRKEGLQEAKVRMQGKSRDSCENGMDISNSRAASPVPSSVTANGEGAVAAVAGAEGAGEEEEEEEEKKDVANEENDQSEPPTEKELELRRKAVLLLSEMDETIEQDEMASVELANARVNLMGPFLCNPFLCDDHSKAQQVSWLATAVRKEKMKMGSTGNRKKIVTAMDLLERNDTLYNTDIEALIEGLPGSEYCTSYVFQAFRTSGAASLNRSWIHEAQLRREKESMKRLKKTKETEEKEHQEHERKKKRKERDDFRDARKRQKVEEEEEKKKARAEERLSRLKIQVEERLLSEASFQREKAIVGLSRNLAKEFARRRKAAETVAAQAVVEAKVIAPKAGEGPETLPPLSKVYEEDTLRVWNFMTTFGSFFLERGYITEVPTLDSLQSAVDCLRDDSTATGVSKVRIFDAVSSLTDLAVALCKPLAASLTRTLFASLIALNPTLQKDFGAAFFNEVNAAAKEKEDADDSSHPDILLPVNEMTWQDIARTALLSDALGELGYQRHEAAHILRGYRSAGHPNSKESRRLRKAEDFWIALVRQEAGLGGEEDGKPPRNILRIDVPCRPLCACTDFRYFLHNIKSLEEATLPEIKSNIVSAITALERSDDASAKQCLEDVDRVHQLLEENCSLKADSKVVRKIKNACSKLFEKYAGKATSEFAVLTASGDSSEEWPWQAELRRMSEVRDIAMDGQQRQRMGLLNSLSITMADFKKFSHVRESYMEEALRFKDEEKRKQAKADDDEEEDDEDDDEDEGESGLISAVVIDGEKDPSTALSTEEKQDSTAVTDDAIPGIPKNGCSNGSVATALTTEPSRIGRPTEFDDFCGDIPTAPEHIRRCLAVLRTICLSGQSSIILDPVDPQSNPGYYDTVLRPMCLREVGKHLQLAADKVRELDGEKEEAYVEQVVAEFGRNVRLIEQNTRSYANAGPTVVSMGSELLRIFERLFLDWVLAPEHLLPPFEDLDDDKCIEHHTSDEESTVLFCDGCEGKFNINRLVPPLLKVPKGDWYCPRCVKGRWWGHLDPRLGKVVKKVFKLDGGGFKASGPDIHIRACFFRYADDANSKPSLMYSVESEGGAVETWSLEEVDRALEAANLRVPPIRCLEAVAESPGYASGVDFGLRKELVPVQLNPTVSDSAAQVALSSSIFRDTVSSSATLLMIDPKNMTANEWLRLLVLLTMKCSSSDVLQTVVSKMENKAAEEMQEPLERLGKVTSIKDILPKLCFEGSDEEEEEEVEVEEGPKESSEEPLRSIVAPVAVAVQEVAASAASVSKSTSLQENGGHPSVVVEASAVEIVEDGGPEPIVPDGNTIDTPTVIEVAVEKEMLPTYSVALVEKKRRRKAVEDSISAYCIKSQLRPTVASFLEDAVSRVVDSSLSSSATGLDFASLRCRRMVCDFCSLTDVALGTPLVRVPNEEEWTDLLPHTSRNRRVHLVANIPTDQGSERGLQEDVVPGRSISVRIRVDGEVFSVRDRDLDATIDGGMLEFLPRSDVGFQSELRFRDETGLPFVTGSLSAHECCVVAAHNSRKELMVQRHKERQAELIEKEAGMSCGRTLEIGRDSRGRTYWKFSSDPKALFVCVNSVDNSSGLASARWHRFSDAQSIASVMACLGKESIVKDMQRSYPDAARSLQDGSWSNALLKQQFPRVAALLSGDVPVDKSTRERQVEGGFEPYEIGEQVLVESQFGPLLWDSTVTGISKKASSPSNSLLIDAYRVEYSGWSTHFTEWVAPERVVEPNENNKLLQEELLEERSASRLGLPTALNMLTAKDYLQARDRARGNVTLPDFASVAQVANNSSLSEKTVGLMKAAILAIEAALPAGSVDTTESGLWSKKLAQQWRFLVAQADGPARLLQCVILLEDAIGEDWIKPDVGHLRSCLPARWKAIGECFASSLAVRVILLDRSIMYGTVDRKRFGTKKKSSSK